MSKTVQIYNASAVYTSPSPATGYHFLNADGILNNNYQADSSNTNLVFPINRIISANYSLKVNRTEVKQLGNISNISRPILTPSDITLELEYYQMGLINEARLGFILNNPTGEVFLGDYFDNTGVLDPILLDDKFEFLLSNGLSSNICPISGFLDRTYQRSDDTVIGWPLTYRDSRNIFIALRNDNNDIKNNSSNPTLNTEINVLGFGNCFINSYKTSASVTQLPKCSVQFTCDNVEYYNSGSGNYIPAVNVKDGKVYSGIYFNIPNNFNSQSPTVVLPSELLLSLSSNTPKLDNLSIDIDDAKIQDYEITLNLNREPLYNLGYKLPLDRRINLPVIAELNFNMIVGDSRSGSFTNLLREDTDYNISIKLNYQRNQALSGVAVQYDFIGAKFQNISFNHSIGNKKVATLSFSTELNPNKNDNGFFMSGQLGVLPPQNSGAVYLGDDFNSDSVVDTLIFEDGSKFTLNSSGFLNINPILY